ncbi:hypothetical protein M422DRAFT_32746 [Sphaerobolus stellatus SS14]|uniref:Uncharacterized protein n=1 Tax=Sphaerobolus stellatus (strain SS14) TaxID=990650 RepID=A0A0C9VNZ2_SPHS4|nr:hypothetical protein M422DRAFT_32746 [Sphaerobolus stellatus SS14]
MVHVNDAFYLHGLASNPSKHLPPGKSLLSIISARSTSSDDDHNQTQAKKRIQEQVTQLATRAFWDEAFESLSSPTPAVQLSRLRLLNNDLYEVVKPLIPPSYPIMDTLSDPLSPTSAPLVSAAGHLRELVGVLRERCAPTRDAELDELMGRLKDVPSVDLPRAYVDVVKGILHIAEKMKEDMTDFVLGTWTESDAKAWVKQKAMDMEHLAVFELFSSKAVRDSFREWLGPETPINKKTLASRVIKAIGSQSPVSPFPPSDNLLPPPLMFSSHDFLRIQNLSQAIAIVASLRSLVRPTHDNDYPWLSRVWTLLEIEADKDIWEPAETKLINLEDEVIQAASLNHDSEAQSRLRDAVQRTLRKDSPVFLLLMSRLLAGLEARLAEEDPPPSQIPIQMRTGRKLQINTQNDAKDAEHKERELIVKGFEDPILKEALRKVLGKIRIAIAWIEESWGDFLEEV